MQFCSKYSLNFSSLHLHHQDWGSHQGFIWCLTRASSELAHLQKAYALAPLNKLLLLFFSHEVGSDSFQPRGLHSPWNSPGQHAGVGRLSILQGIFPTQGSSPGLPYCRQIVYQLSRKGSPLSHCERPNGSPAGRSSSNLKRCVIYPSTC